MLKHADHEIAMQSLLLSNVPRDIADTLLERAATHSYDRGATIFLHGEPANAVHIVLEGWVKLFRISPNGAEAVVGVFTKGRSFAEAAAFRGDVYPVAAEAVSLPCHVLSSGPSPGRPAGSDATAPIHRRGRGRSRSGPGRSRRTSVAG